MRRTELLGLLSLLLIGLVVVENGYATEPTRTKEKLGKSHIYCDLEGDQVRLVLQKGKRFISGSRFIQWRSKKVTKLFGEEKGLRTKRKLTKIYQRLNPSEICDGLISQGPTPPTPGGGSGGSGGGGNTCAISLSSANTELSEGSHAATLLQLQTDCSGPIRYSVLQQSGLFHGALDGNSLEVTAPNFSGEEPIWIRATDISGSYADAVFVYRTTPIIHSVRVIDHQFIPANITVDEGDVVQWNWEADFHDVEAGTSITNPTNAFSSGLLNRGAFFQVGFTRHLLNTFPEAGDEYNYFCNPHFSMGMNGKVSVVRQPHYFLAAANPFEAGDGESSTPEANCLLEFRESMIEVQCSYQTELDQLELGIGDLNEQSGTICSHTVESGNKVACILSSNERDMLFNGQLFVRLGGENLTQIRGQVLLWSGSSQIEGQVRDTLGEPLAGVQVSDGFRTSITDAVGRYIITDVPNGVYQLTAAKEGYLISPDAFVSPAVVNGTDVNLRTFTATINQ